MPPVYVFSRADIMFKKSISGEIIVVQVVDISGANFSLPERDTNQCRILIIRKQVENLTIFFSNYTLRINFFINQ